MKPCVEKSLRSLVNVVVIDVSAAEDAAMDPLGGGGLGRWANKILLP